MGRRMAASAETPLTKGGRETSVMLHDLPLPRNRRGFAPLHVGEDFANYRREVSDSRESKQAVCVRGFSAREMTEARTLMHVKALTSVEYESRCKWHAEMVTLPTWSRIEEAIGRLDKFHYPYLHLWPT